MNGFLPDHPNLVDTIWKSNNNGTLHIIQHCFTDEPIVFNEMGYRFVKWFKPCKRQTKYVFHRCLEHPGQCAAIQWKNFQQNYTHQPESQYHNLNARKLMSTNEYIRSIQS